MTLRRTSRLAADETVWLFRFLAARPLFRLYLDSALADLTAGLDNRWALIGARRAGCLLGIEFDSLTVFTAIGDLEPAELAAMLSAPAAGELHVEPPHEAVLAPLCGGRLIDSREMRIYGRSTAGAVTDPAARRLTGADSDSLNAFMHAHNPRTVISRWMLAQPFVALTEGDEITAVAGTIARQRELALVGNFLTRPDRRDRGLARRLALHLTALLRQEGVATALLATTVDNVAACRAYESAGFTLLETRRQLDLHPRESMKV
jgi:GNAT superfamily N-acetyltransferase